MRTVDAGDAPNELPSENKGFHGQRGEADHPLLGGALKVFVLFPGVEAGTGFADVGGDLVVSHDQGVGVLIGQDAEKVGQRQPLHAGASVCGASLLIEPAFVADADAVAVESAYMRSGFAHGPAVVQPAVAGDVEVVADVAETSCEMTFTKTFDGEGNIAARGAAMDDQ